MTERLFGTNGVRGIINVDMTSDLALQMGKAIGTVMGGTVAIATDTRISADMIKTAVSSGIMSVGVNVLDLGVLPTPAIQYYVKTHDNVKGGVMITASHNPPQFNGIKCISSDGTEASREEEEQVEAKYSERIPCAPWNLIGDMYRIGGAGEEYVDAVISRVDADAIKKAELKVCLDCANGAAYETSPLLLKKLNVRAITINCNPQGEFPGHPSEPTEENLRDLISLTRATRSDLGIAHDGDADRCVFITDGGKFVSGDKSLALISKYVLSEKKGIVVTPVSSSSLVEEVVRESGGEIRYTAVGSPVVARKMIETGAVFGGEENGGLIFPEQQYCRDGAMTIAKMLECIVRDGPLKGQISDLPVYHTVKTKVECPDDMKKHVLEYLAGSNDGTRIDSTDGLKIIFDDGWVLARPSGTEPIFRIYSESKDEEAAKSRAHRYEALVMEYLNH
ncbi:MAG: phosphoglucosamine mutase [Candidatus Methanoplasma sp.]|jgi:phosphomannomutase/phosphoglucomutase|nr:phosphoglucosamine mutase [Candidatus Methanoplasma sp.]